MRGICTPETDKFKNFFALVQAEAKSTALYSFWKAETATILKVAIWTALIFSAGSYRRQRRIGLKKYGGKTLTT